jgi:S-DNA-T family DNA segregation ATPase FtsK/SpoIIIE
MLAERERRFAEHDIDGMPAYRALRANGSADNDPADDPYGDVFLVVDGWLTLRKDFDDLEEVIIGIATRGLNYGVHLLVTSARWFDMRSQIRDLFGSRIELRLGDPIDTGIDRVGALRVPEAAPGRGLAATKHQVLTALPRVDGHRSAEDLSAGVAGLVDAVTRSWTGEPAPELRMLPARVPYLALPPADDPRALEITIGIAEQDLAPVRLDFAADPHLLLLGDGDCGKTTFLRTLARRIVDSYDLDQARMVIVDHRRGLLGEVRTDHLLGFGGDTATTAELIEDAASGLRDRLPGPDVTPEQLRARNWWQGPELFVLVDDYDLVTTQLDNPLLPLLNLLPQGRDIGLHVVVTRRIGGAGRAMYEQFLARLRDVGAMGLMMSGHKDEGPLLGGLKAGPLPPGRGTLIGRRGEPRLVQLAWLPPTE